MIQSTISKGKITAINTGKAEQLPGVLAIFTHQNAPKFNSLEGADFMSGHPGEKLLPLQSDEVYFDGQYIGIVVAETYEQARLAAAVTEITYEIEEPIFDLEQALEQSEKYDAGAGLQPRFIFMPVLI
ncbi:MAG: hypothetical protein AAGE84_12835 [Cyanobacteria bacterium P01_G01_bin.39]